MTAVILAHRTFQPLSRGVVLVAVLVIVTLAALSAAVVVAASGAALIERRVEVDRTRLRLAAWSGINATMQELSAQRDDLLTGFAPAVTAERRFGTTPDGREIVFRLVSAVPDAADSTSGMPLDTTGSGNPPGGGFDLNASPTLVPEAAGIDVNRATAAMLAALPGIDQALAERMIETRPADGYPSLISLLAVEGITPAMLWGSGSQQTSPSTENNVSDTSSNMSVGLVSLLSVHAAVPDVEAGLSDQSAAGQRRLNINVSWSERLGRALDDRFGAGTGSFIQGLLVNGATFTSDSELLDNMVRQIDSAEDWVGPFDALTTQPGQYRVGRVDLNLAPAAVLAALPGIDADAAEQIVERRSRLDDSLRLSPLWPVVEGILSPDQMVEAIDWLDVRTMQWRVRVEVGYRRVSADGLAVPRESGALGPSAGLGPGRGQRSGTLEHMMRFDVVLDVAATRPRLASCHEVTALSWWGSLPSRSAQNVETSEPSADGVSDPADIAESDSSVAAFYIEGTTAGIGSEDAFPEAMDLGEQSEFSTLNEFEPLEDDAGMAATAQQSGDVDNRRGRWTGGSQPGGSQPSGSLRGPAGDASRDASLGRGMNP
jgi:DNA uptake protein ComE-like DNA-binding protein